MLVNKWKWARFTVSLIKWGCKRIPQHKGLPVESSFGGKSTIKPGTWHQPAWAGVSPRASKYQGKQVSTPVLRLTHLSHGKGGPGHGVNSKLICFILPCCCSTTNRLFVFSVSQSSQVGGSCRHEHPMNDSFSFKWNPWEWVPMTWFISYLRFSADSVFVYNFTKSRKFSSWCANKNMTWCHPVSALRALREARSKPSDLMDGAHCASRRRPAGPDRPTEGAGRAVRTVPSPQAHRQGCRWHDDSHGLPRIQATAGAPDALSRSSTRLWGAKGAHQCGVQHMCVRVCLYLRVNLSSNREHITIFCRV